MRRVAAVLALVGAIGCAHRRGAVDVSALIASDGLDGAAAELRFRVVSDPQDRDALIALGAIEERRGRPGAALEALDRAIALGGPPGFGVPADERAHLGELYLERATERVLRGARSAVADLARAKELGAAVPPALERDAALAAALADLRHADPGLRARGAAALAALDGAPPETRSDPTAAAWLWDHGARRAAVDRFERWADAGGLAAPSTTAAMATRYLEARAWWNGVVAPEHLAQARARGAEPCSIAAAPGPDCAPPDPGDATIDAAAHDGSWWRRADQRGWRSNDPAWLIAAARAWLRDDAPSYPIAVAAHLDAPIAPPAWAAPSAARVSGGDPTRALDAAIADASEHGPGPRLVVATEAALAGRPLDQIEPILGPARGALGDELVRRVRGGEPPALPDLAHAAAARAAAQASAPTAAHDLVPIARAYLRDSALGDRVADDWIAGDVDVAARAPIAAALFAALGDPARARARWQRSVDASPGEPALDRGLALAVAAADDPDAAMVLVTGAAAESGDAAPVLVDVARTLAARGHDPRALELIALALPLVAPDARAPLYDLAIAWTVADGKDAAALIAARGPVPAPPPPITDPDALVRAAALSPHAVAPRLGLLALPAGDPRRARARAELAAIAADPHVDPDEADAAWAGFLASRAR